MSSSKSSSPATSQSIRRVRVPLAWQWIELVRQAAAEATSSCPDEVGEGTIMVASELAENLVKYGTSIDDDPSGTVSIQVEDDVVRVESVNGATPEQAEKVIRLVNELFAGDAAALYLQRLGALARSPGAVACELGLLRIGYEGGFSLAVEYVDPRLKLIATRSLP